jgi:hypothetical protein
MMVMGHFIFLFIKKYFILKMSKYVYPGTPTDFYNEFGGNPEKGLGIINIIMIALIIIAIVIIIMTVAFILTQTTITYIPNTTTINLDVLLDLNKPQTQCCVFPGTTATNTQYVYDTTANITYSRQPPLDINTVCTSCPNFSTCVSQNTDSTGKIIPIATFDATPYYTFECGLFVGCASTAPCQ